MRLTHRLAALTLAAAPITTLGIATPAAFAAPAAPATASHTLWLGPQPVTVTAGINAYITGQPHVCIRNNGPHPIRLVTDHVTATRSGCGARRSNATHRAGAAAADPRRVPAREHVLLRG